MKSDKLLAKDKIIAFSDLLSVVKKIDYQTKILIGGCFDIFHYGHLTFLKKSKDLRGYLIIALESDEYIIRNKNRKPTHNQNQRAEILASMEIVDLVIKLPYFSSDKDYFELIKVIKPSYIAVTTGDFQLNNKKKQAKTVGGKVVIVTLPIKKISTQKIINSFISK